MMNSNVKIYINMTSALVMFIGGLVIAIYFPGGLETSYRWIIGVFVTFYFALRIGQSIMLIRRNNQKESGSLHELIHGDEE